MLTIAILAGGQSRRMGQDKAAIFLGKLQKIAQAVAPTIVIGRDTPGAIPDISPHQGPLGGLYTALKHTGHPILAIACDMPEVDAEALQWLISGWEALSAQNLGLVTRHINSENLEPLFAIYSPACLPLIELSLQNGHRSLQKFIYSSNNFAFCDAPLEIQQKLSNINTPEELEEYREVVRKIAP
jgi:molybdenum cofactor guanylyltransferase